MTVFCPLGNLYKSWPAFPDGIEYIGPATIVHPTYLEVDPLLVAVGNHPYTRFITLPSMDLTGLHYEVQFENVVVNNSGLVSNFKQTVGIALCNNDSFFNYECGIWFSDNVYSSSKDWVWRELNTSVTGLSPINLVRGVHGILMKIEVLSYISGTSYQIRQSARFTSGPLTGANYSNIGIDTYLDTVRLVMFSTAVNYDSYSDDNSCQVTNVLIYHPSLPGGAPCPGWITASYTADAYTIAISGTVNFTDTSESYNTITSWLWDFDDTTTSPLQNPNHSWSSVGVKHVTLTVTSIDGSDPVTHDITVVPDTPLNLTGSQVGSTNEVALTWDTATGANWYILERDTNPSFSSPTEIYTGAANAYNDFVPISNTYYYRVRGVDTVSGVISFWSTTFSLLVIIEIIADFVGSPVEGWSTLTVNFTDLSTSTGAITSWDWDFGDGSPHSSVQNPSHDYSVAGFYTVTLIASGGISSDTTYKTDYIHVIVTIADFIGTPTIGITPLVVQFIDQSIGDPDTWDWDFGDGSPHSYLQNPVHIYNEADTYDVTLKIKKYGITNEIVRSAYIKVISVDFLGVPLRGVKNLTVNFIDLSVGVFDQWYWEFGDGYSSTEQNPVHYYKHPGEYTVSLMVTIEEKTFISIKQNYVLVSGDVTYDIAISPIRKAFLWGSGSVNKKDIGIEIKRIYGRS